MQENCKDSSRTKSIVMILLLALTTLAILIAKPAPANAGTGRVIDLFTQKTPFDGKGANQSSDAFQPDELVVLSALVTYNDAPVAQKDVAFYVRGSPNAIQNITISGSSTTDQNGLAQFSFRIPWPSENPEEIVFGEWRALATVSIADQTVVDTLTFQAGWIIRITKIVTLDVDLNPKVKFLRQDVIAFNLTVQNIALTEKTGTITLDVQDATGWPIIHLQMKDLVIEPGENYFLATSQIPAIAAIGQATVVAAPYTIPPENGGVLYSPAISSNFEIVNRDIAVTGIWVSSNTAYIGDIIQVNATVTNRGSSAETFDLSIFYDSFLIETRHVGSLASSSQMTLAFLWNTSSVNEGSYQISATAPLIGDLNPGDNTLSDGIVQIRVRGQLIHDVAVLNVVPSARSIYVGETLNILVSLKNKGTEPESFYVTVYYDDKIIDRKLVATLAPQRETQIPFSWNTLGVASGNYTLSATADKVEGETETEDNTFVDGAVTLLPPAPPSQQTFFLTWGFLAFTLVLTPAASIVLLLLLYYLRRRRKRKLTRLFTILGYPHI